jgi:hypothetical protein
MLFQVKPLSTYTWENLASFRAYIQEYFSSINDTHEAKHDPGADSDDLSLSENSGYIYIPSC